MPANALYPALSHGDLQATASFTERANTMVDGFFSCFGHRFSLLLPRRQAPETPSQHVQGKGKRLGRLL
jgi:hypothetical protein